MSRSTGLDTGARVAGEELRVVRMAGEEVTPALRALIAALDPTAPGDYRELAAALAQSFRAHRPRRIGLAGGQGTGKSTLSRLLERACDQVGIRACVLSLDDYYLPRAERLALARRVHRLFETRGPPGTHDVALCRAQMTSLSGNGEIDLPVFVDEKRVVYQALEFKRPLLSFLTPKVFKRAAEARKSGFTQPGVHGDAFQLGGVLLRLPDGSTPYKYVSTFAGDHPKLDDLKAEVRRALR